MARLCVYFLCWSKKKKGDLSPLSKASAPSQAKNLDGGWRGGEEGESLEVRMLSEVCMEFTVKDGKMKGQERMRR